MQFVMTSPWVMMVQNGESLVVAIRVGWGRSDIRGLHRAIGLPG